MLEDIQELFRNLQFKKAIKIMFRRETKGGKKVNLRDRPYLDVEVVEVKVKKKKEIPKICINCDYKEGCTFYQRNYKKLEKEGTWVNGENIDKIEFPCACTYDLYGERRCGILTSGIPIMESEYILHSINPQMRDSVEVRKASLEELIKQYDIHIEKAKIVIFKETNL